MNGYIIRVLRVIVCIFAVTGIMTGFVAAGDKEPSKAALSEIEENLSALEAKEAESDEQDVMQGIVDTVDENMFVINDLAVRTKKTTQFLNEYGRHTSRDSFKKGDSVTLTSAMEGEGIEKTIYAVSIAHRKADMRKKTQPRKKAQEGGQEIKKVDGVWVN